ncbi:Uncharacterised protein [Mycobacteroides abscessus subsp. abscessus]|nr:Uncharacterised protein [Mycobacteroides abscessus subsp. abscessus]
MNATVNCETGSPDSPSAESTPRPTAKLSPITSSGSSAVNSDRYTMSRISAISPAVAIDTNSKSCSAEEIWSLNVAAGPVTWALTPDPVNTAVVMSRTAPTDSAAVGSPSAPAMPTGRYQAFPSRLTAWVRVTGSASRSCTSSTWAWSARNRSINTPYR